MRPDDELDTASSPDWSDHMLDGGARCGGWVCHGQGMIRLMAEDPAVVLDEEQARRITFWLLEFVPARGCQVRREPVVEIAITGHEPAELHRPLLQKVEDIAGCRFTVVVTDD
jgi:hypothetical protein